MSALTVRQWWYSAHRPSTGAEASRPNARASLASATPAQWCAGRERPAAGNAQEQWRTARGRWGETRRRRLVCRASWLPSQCRSMTGKREDRLGFGPRAGDPRSLPCHRCAPPASRDELGAAQWECACWPTSAQPTAWRTPFFVLRRKLLTKTSAKKLGQKTRPKNSAKKLDKSINMYSFSLRAANEGGFGRP